MEASFRGDELERQVHRAAHGDRGQESRRAARAERARAAQERREHRAHLEPRQRRAEAEVDARAERDVVDLRALHAERWPSSPYCASSWLAEAIDSMTRLSAGMVWPCSVTSRVVWRNVDWVGGATRGARWDARHAAA
jgi:hypothetical protein